MPGPPPKDPSQRRRRNLPPEVTTLPAEGRKGRPPKWPLPGRMRAGELAAWRQVWATPQAVMWQRLGWARTVARYVRVLVAAEELVGLPTTMTEARQLEDRLGLTPMSMKRLQWRIATDEVAAARTTRAVAPSGPKSTSTRRLRAVDPGAVARG